jgi:hypothetical protein
VPRFELARQEETDVAGLAADALGVVLVAAGLGSTSTPAIPFGLTAAMARRGASTRAVVDALLLLRDAVVVAGDLDPRTEPVPLVVAEADVAAVSLVAYLRGLIERAAAASSVGNDAVAARALEHLAAR